MKRQQPLLTSFFGQDKSGPPPVLERVVECPVCGKSIYLSNVNAHLDSGCVAHIPEERDIAASLKLRAQLEEEAKKAQSHTYLQTPIPGLILIPDFIAHEQELVLLQELDSRPWEMATYRGRRWRQVYGCTVDYRMGALDFHSVPPVPKAYETLFAQIRAEVPRLNDFMPNELACHRYFAKEAHSIAFHVDDRQRAGDFIGNLSLEGYAHLSFKPQNPVHWHSRKRLRDVPDVQLDDGRVLPLFHERDNETVDVLLPRRSLAILTDESRYNWEHAILAGSVLSQSRVSITIRQQRNGV